MNNEKVSGIYKIINKVNGKYYVGSSEDILGYPSISYGRKYQHFYLLSRNKHHSLHLQQSWNKHGESNFELFIINNMPDATGKELLAKEQIYLDIAKTEKHMCYNCSFIAGKIEMTLETRNKIRQKSTLRLSNKENHPLFGKHHSEETKRKISISNTGKTVSEEAKQKISFAHKGKKTGPRPEFSGKNNPNYKKAIFKIKNIETNEIFEGTQHEFYIKYNYRRGGINAILYGRCLTIDKKWILLSIDNIDFKSTIEPDYDMNIYTFINVITKESFVGLLKNFTKKYNLTNTDKLIKGKQKFVKDWMLTVINDINFECHLSKFHREIYTFYHNISKESFIGLKKDFVKKYNLNPGHVSNLVNQKTKFCKEWILKAIDETPTHIRQFRPQFDKTIYTFYNSETKNIFKGYRKDFTKNYGLDRHYITKLIRKNINSVKGWIIIGIINPSD